MTTVTVAPRFWPVSRLISPKTGGKIGSDGFAAGWRPEGTAEGNEQRNALRPPSWMTLRPGEKAGVGADGEGRRVGGAERENCGIVRAGPTGALALLGAAKVVVFWSLR